MKTATQIPPDFDPMLGITHPAQRPVAANVRAASVLGRVAATVVNVSIVVVVVWFGWHALNAGATYLGVKIGEAMKAGAK